jgi:hypothetical protein
MTSKAHNAKKPKLASHHVDNSHHQMSSLVPGAEAPVSNGSEGTAPEKHKLSFAQHQHEREASAAPIQDAPTHHLKSDAQQHQQKSGSHK